MVSACLLVLCGIPGAGKSTWAQEFLRYVHDPDRYGNIAEFSLSTATTTKETGFRSTTHEKTGKVGEDRGGTNGVLKEKGRKDDIVKRGRYGMIHIAYDDLIPEEVEAELIHDARNHSKETKGQCWKTCRRAIAKCVDDSLEEISSLRKTNEQVTVGCQTSSGTDDMRQIFTDATLATQVTGYLSRSQVSSDGVTRMCESSSVDNNDGHFDRFGSTDLVDATVCANTDAKNGVEDAKGLNEANLEGNKLLATVTEKLKEMLKSVVRQQVENDSVCWVVIIDDNMYYSSMRYEYFQIARKHTSGFAQVYFPVEVATALRRNQKRQQRVDESVIREMFDKLEQPCAQNIWERYTATWSEVDSDQRNFEKIVLLIDEAASNPMMPVFDDRQGAEESRAICSTSLLHQADIVLRKILGSHLAQSKDIAKSKTERSQLAVSCNSARSQILDSLRNQTLLIPPNMSVETHCALTCAENPFHLFLKNVFHEQLKQIL